MFDFMEIIQYMFNIITIIDKGQAYTCVIPVAARGYSALIIIPHDDQSCDSIENHIHLI